MNQEWSGHYTNTGGYRSDDAADPNRHIFPISAVLNFRGRLVEGQMTDDVAPCQVRASTLLADLGSRMGRRHRLGLEQLIQHDPGASGMTKLPAISSVRGQLRGNLLELTKLYQGQTETVWMIGGIEHKTVSDCPPVFYSGEFDETLGVFEGAWKIRAGGILGRLRRPTDQGEFSLRRVGG